MWDWCRKSHRHACGIAKNTVKDTKILVRIFAKTTPPEWW